MAQFQVADVAGAFNRGQQFKHQAEIRPLQIAQQQQALAGQQQQFNRQQKLAPVQFQSAQLGVQEQQQAIDQRTDQQKNQSLLNAALTIDTLSDEQIIPFLEQRLADAPEGSSMTETVNALNLAKTGDFDTVRSRANNLIEIGVRQGDIKAPTGQQQQSAEGKSFENLIADFSEEDKTKARRRKAGLDPRAVGSAIQTITEKGSVTNIAEVEKALTSAKEEGKLEVQQKFKPRIAAAVKLAESKAKERGEVLNDLSRMEASLPGVKDAVDELIELSSLATSTFAGRVFDTAVKESGFGSTKGADARAKLIAIVDNQVLPLLKETFGAAFTVAEGENLKSSLVDPNASPSQKREQLSAFITQKERNIRTKQAQLSQESSQGTSDDELKKRLGL